MAYYRSCRAITRVPVKPQVGVAIQYACGTLGQVLYLVLSNLSVIARYSHAREEREVCNMARTSWHSKRPGLVRTKVEWKGERRYYQVYRNLALFQSQTRVVVVAGIKFLNLVSDCFESPVTVPRFTSS